MTILAMHTNDAAKPRLDKAPKEAAEFGKAGAVSKTKSERQLFILGFGGIGLSILLFGGVFLPLWGDTTSPGNENPMVMPLVAAAMCVLLLSLTPLAIAVTLRVRNSTSRARTFRRVVAAAFCGLAGAGIFIPAVGLYRAGLWPEIMAGIAIAAAYLATRRPGKTEEVRR